MYGSWPLIMPWVLHPNHSGGMPAPFREPRPKPKKVCTLPSCEELTDHNGGYCCADHCKQHRELRKKRV
jgi:hypothetical protein